MATEPQKSNLINLLVTTISDNTEAIGILSERLPETQEIIDYFEPSCRGFDIKIVSLASSINAIQTEIISLYTNAYSVGCGTTAGATVLYPDTIKNRSYNISTNTYDSDSPYDENSTTLTTSNVGFGTFVVFTQNDSSVSGLGSMYASIDSCFGTPCVSGTCVSFAASITSKQTEIVSIRAELLDLVSPVNAIKTERNDYEIRRYSDKYTIRILTEENSRISAAITTIQNPLYDLYT